MVLGPPWKWLKEFLLSFYLEDTVEDLEKGGRGFICLVLGLVVIVVEEVVMGRHGGSIGSVIAAIRGST